MAKLRTFKSLVKGTYVLSFELDIDALAPADRDLLAKFGEPEINVGGVFFGGAELKAVLSGSTVSSVIVVDGGNNFSSAPAVTASSTSGSGALFGTPVMSGGLIVSVPVSAAGTGYLTAPTLLVAAQGNEFTLPAEYVKIRSGLPFTKEFDPSAAVFAINVQAKVNGYKAEIQRRWSAALLALRTEADGFTGEEITEV